MADCLTFPRKLSVNDDGYGPTHGLIDVFVDGVEIHEVVSYDIDAGTVERLVPEGENETIRGTVTIGATHMASMNDLEARLNKLAAWQYLNVATFIGVCVIIVLLVL